MGKPFVRVEREMAVQVLRVAPVEGVAAAGGRTAPHDTTWHAGITEKHSQLLDLCVMGLWGWYQNKGRENLLTEFNAKTTIICTKVHWSDHVLSVL